MDLEFIKWVAAQGPGIAVGIVFFFLWRNSDKERKQAQASLLRLATTGIEAMKDVTAALERNGARIERARNPSSRRRKTIRGRDADD